MLAKRFFFVSAGILCLALAYHFGATNATAQAPGNPVVGLAQVSGATFTIAAATSNGDVYGTGDGGLTWSHVSNVFGGATPAARQTWGQLKARYR